jgi:hypothetical protein
MKITFKTLINKDFDIVVDGFNQNLFEYLMPLYCFPVLKRYDGQQHGDMVHLSFRLPGINDWKVVVKEAGKTDKLFWIVHRGLVMPFALAFWQHSIRVVSLKQNKTAIIDQIEFNSKWKILNPLNYLILFFIFFPRKIFYKSYYKGKMQGPEQT